MASFMRGYESQTYAALRIVAGFLMLWHGMQKLFGFPPGMPPDVPAFIIWIGGPIEFFGGILVMIGLFTRWTAFILSGFMAFAYWMGHGWRALLPIMNQGELAALYCFTFLYISAHGPGIWSADAARGE
jgi:putative oxidoreductase